MKPHSITALLTGCLLLVSVIHSPAPPFPKGGGGRKGPSGPGGGGRPGGGGLPFGNSGGFNPAGQMQQQLPTAQIQQLTSAFNQNDRNRDGRMSQPEFGNLMQNSAMQQLTQKLPIQGGNQQQQISQLFQQITGGKGSFDVNQLLGFAGKMLQMKAGPQSAMPRQPQRQPSLFQRLPKPPFQLPFGSDASSSGTNSSNSGTGTNATTSGSTTNTALQMNLNEAMDQGYVTARFGNNSRSAGTTMQLRLFATEKSTNKKLTLHLNEGTRIIPKNRIYTPVRVLGFDRTHPNSFTIGRSGASYWPIRVSRERGDGRVPLGYVEFRIVE